MRLTQPRSEPDLPHDAASAGGCRAARAHAPEKLRSSAKPRRPDRAVYVPRALRAPPAAAPGTPARAPPGRNPPPPCDDAELPEAETFYIGDYFANGQLGFYRPSCFECGPEYGSWGADDADEMSAVPSAPGDDGGAAIIAGAPARRKDEDGEAAELRRASREINRSSKRIIKQSFDSDELVIPSRTLEPRAALRREENDWDAVFDDSGECLDPSLLEELTATVGRVSVSRARAAYAPDAPAAPPPPDDSFAHVLEVYDFPSEFKTHDLLALFSEYKDSGFEVKWVDDTHALLVFSSANVAAEALGRPRSLARCRPLHAATLESRNKARRCAEFLQPYRQRPETCAALARRLVSGALGVRLGTAAQERAEERRLITRARERKRQAALHKEAAWDGSLANASLDA